MARARSILMPADSVAVPDLASEETKLEQLQQQVRRRDSEPEQLGMSVPSFRATHTYVRVQYVPACFVVGFCGSTGPGESLMYRLLNVSYGYYA